jgi:hypothetical protein
MVEQWQIELEKVKQIPQDQHSLISQLFVLRIIANKFGLYDASDYLLDSIQNEEVI